MRVWATLCVLCVLAGVGLAQSDGLPSFARDTVLVWDVQSQDLSSEFVVRIAGFLPERFIEWENASTQGTVRMTSKAVSEATVFVNSRMFEAGVDKTAKKATTLWLSEKMFRRLNDEGKVKLTIDSLRGWMQVTGSESLVVQVNKTPVSLPVLVVQDSRGMERWFLNDPKNPLMVQHRFRAFRQTLRSVTTNRSNTLRWIKGKKLP